MILWNWVLDSREVVYLSITYSSSTPWDDKASGVHRWVEAFLRLYSDSNDLQVKHHSLICKSAEEF